MSMAIADRFALVRLLFWLVALAGAAGLVVPVLAEDREWRHMLEPSGQAAILLLAATLAVAPVKKLLPDGSLQLWLVRLRRDFGLAAFAFATLHMAGTVFALGRLDYVIQGLAWASMWTGWAGWALLVPVAITSTGAAHRLLGHAWKPVQRLTWPAAALSAWHWYLQSHGSSLFWATVGVIGALELVRIGLVARRPH